MFDQATAASTMAVKKSRNALTLHEKSIVKGFCEQRIDDAKLRSQPTPSQDVLRKEIQVKFGFEVARSTLSKILALDWKCLNLNINPNPNMKRKRKPLFPQFESELVAFIQSHMTAKAEPTEQQAEANDAKSSSTGVLTEALILEEAQRLKELHGIKDEQLVLSVGWLAKFKARNGIRLRKGTATASTKADSSSTHVNAPTPLAGLSNETMSRLFEMDSPGSMTGVVSPSTFAATAAAALPEVPAKKRKKAPVTTRRSLRNSSGVSTPPAPAVTAVGSPTLDSCLASASRSEADALSSFRLLDKPSFLCHCGSGETSPYDPIVQKLPADVCRLRCGCALDPIVPMDIQGLRVIIAGRHASFEAYVASALVGPMGSVVCIETDSIALTLAVNHLAEYTKLLGYNASNVHFVSTATEMMALQQTRSADLVMLNCSFRTATSKEKVLEAAFALVKQDAGEVRFTDVCSSRRLGSIAAPIIAELLTQVQALDTSVNDASGLLEGPASQNGQRHTTAFNANSNALGEVLSCAYVEDHRRLCQRLGAGQMDVRMLTQRSMPSLVAKAPKIQQTLQANFRFRTFRCFYMTKLEDRLENYGQRATFHGNTTADNGASYQLDDQFTFTKAITRPVDSNTARLLSKSWVRAWFHVDGDDMTFHYGAFTAQGS